MLLELLPLPQVGDLEICFGDVGIDWKLDVPCVGEQLQVKLGFIR